MPQYFVSNLKLSMSMLARDWHAGEWRVLLISLVLAVGSISTVGLFADRVRQALQQEAHGLLGADLRVTSIRPIPQSYKDVALQNKLNIVTTATFPSMVSSDDENILCEVQAVEERYPLRGEILIFNSTDILPTTNGDPAGHIASGGPSRGTLWADERLMRRMSVKVGDTLKVGLLSFRLSARIVKDVDQAVSFASIAPRVYINKDDLHATGLEKAGSRINYRLLVSGEVKQIEHFRTRINAKIKPGEKLEDVGDARPEIRQAMERAEHFLGLAALMAFVLAGIAMALAARQFISRHLDSCAVLRCLGATQVQVLMIFLYQFLLLGVIAVMLGGIIGWAVQSSLVQSIEALRDANLPAPGWIPLLQSGISGMALLLGFTFLPLWQLKSVSPLRVIRRELGIPSANTNLVYVTGSGVLCLLFLWQAGSIKLGITVLAGLVAGLFLFGIVAWSSLRILAAFPLGNRHIFANLSRHGRGNAVQIVALSLGGMSLLLLTLVRTELLQNWRERLPLDAPNRYILNIQQDQREQVKEFFKKHSLSPPSLFPMVRGRLVAINNINIKSEDYPDPRSRALVERETNLSWSETIPDGNQLTQGKWWSSESSAVKPVYEISLEEGFAKTLNIAVDDILTYDITGSELTTKVVNLRKLRWDSMQVNFFVITPPGLLEKFPGTFLSSFYLPPDKINAGDQLLKLFPNLLVFDTEAIITQVRHIMDQIAQTLGAVFMFTLLSGLAVLYAALLATQDERIYQTAIMRTLGADSRYLLRQHLTEFAVLGALGGLFAAVGSATLGWILAKYILEIPFTPTADLWLIGIGGGMVTVMTAGWLVTRKAIKMPPLQVLAT